MTALSFSPDGSLIAIGHNRTTTILKVDDGTITTRLHVAETNVESDLYVRSVCFSSNGQFLAVGAEAKVIHVYACDTWGLIAVLKGHQSDVYAIDVAPDSQLIASVSADCTARLWRSDTFQQIQKYSFAQCLTSIAFAPDGRRIVAGSLDKIAYILSRDSSQPVREPQKDTTHHDSVYAVRFATNSKAVFSGSLDKTFKCWEILDSSISRCVWQSQFEVSQVSLCLALYAN